MCRYSTLDVFEDIDALINATCVSYSIKASSFIFFFLFFLRKVVHLLVVQECLIQKKNSLWRIEQTHRKRRLESTTDPFNLIKIHS
jgi:hypothetical protein